MKIGNREIGDNLRPYIIAEIGVNHEGDIELAKRLIEEAAEGGAHAAKFQTYKAETIASKNSPAYWDTSKEPTKSQFELFSKYDSFDAGDYKKLSIYCNNAGVDFLSTPFDLRSVDFLSLLVPAFKIASADITNVPLLRKIAKTEKPVLLSTGASTIPEIDFAVKILEESGCSDLALLHCVLNYPTPPENAQLGMITTLKRIYPKLPIGYSDHVAPDETLSSLEASMLLGACILEKHFTNDKSKQGNDHYHAMDKEDLKRFKNKALQYRKLISGWEKDINLEQEARINARRSIVAACEIEVGEIFTENNIITKRPGYGIGSVHWDEVIGRRCANRLIADQLLTWKDVI